MIGRTRRLRSLTPLIPLAAPCAAAALALSLTPNARPSEPFSFGFSAGEHPVDPRSPAVMQRVGLCAECHPRQHAAWSDSRHGLAWTNDVFTLAFADEPRRWCVNCHAPLDAQAAEVRLDLYQARLSSDRLLAIPPAPHAEEGVGCPACHVRDGEVLVNKPGSQLHPSRFTPELRDPALCGGCHEFPLHDQAGRPTATPMQATLTEWRQWAKTQPASPTSPSPPATCVDCHMPGADHRLRGVYDRAWLQQSVKVTALPPTTGHPGTLTVETVNVGHHFPTGDVFRHLTLEELPPAVPSTLANPALWREIAWIGRRFEVVELPGGAQEKRLTLDTALRPGVPVTFPWAGGPWRLRYHYVSDEEERRRRMPEEAIVWTGWEGF